jgi:hypothetical protein
MHTEQCPGVVKMPGMIINDGLRRLFAPTSIAVTRLRSLEIRHTVPEISLESQPVVPSVPCWVSRPAHTTRTCASKPSPILSRADLLRSGLPQDLPWLKGWSWIHSVMPREEPALLPSAPSLRTWALGLANCGRDRMGSTRSCGLSRHEYARDAMPLRLTVVAKSLFCESASGTRSGKKLTPLKNPSKPTAAGAALASEGGSKKSTGAGERCLTAGATHTFETLHIGKWWAFPLLSRSQSRLRISAGR